MRYFIIEHPTRGVLKDNSEYQEPHFSPENGRGDDRNMRFYHIVQARRGLERYVTPKLRDDCVIRISPQRAPSNAAYLAMTPSQRLRSVEWEVVS